MALTKTRRRKIIKKILVVGNKKTLAEQIKSICESKEQPGCEIKEIIFIREDEIENYSIPCDAIICADIERLPALNLSVLDKAIELDNVECERVPLSAQHKFRLRKKPWESPYYYGK